MARCRVSDAVLLPQTARLDGLALAFTGGEGEVAAALANGLATFGARLVAADGEAPVVLITEALAGGAPAELHAGVLAACQRLRAAGRHLVLLEPPVPVSPPAAPTGLVGLARTLRLEWPEVRVSAWRLPDGGPERCAGPVAAALRVDPGDADLAADGTARRLELDRGVRPGAPGPRAARPVWLVTGGGRGVTADCAVALAERMGGTFLLAGRSAAAPWPDGVAETADLKALRGTLAMAARARGEALQPAELDRHARSALAGAEIRGTLRRITRAGAAAHYVMLDVSDAGAVAAGLAALVAAHGTITGLVHGAGVLADGRAELKTGKDVARVFAPKVDGLGHLLAHLDLTALTHVGLFSSASAIYGNPGQADYAMANACLNAWTGPIAAAAPGARVAAFCWGPWDGGMVDETLARHFRARGIGLIPRLAGASVFADYLTGGPAGPDVLVVGEGWAGS